MNDIAIRAPSGMDVAGAELAKAMAEYSRHSGRLYPTWSEVLEVVRSLGYRKPGADDEVGPSGPGASPRDLILITPACHRERVLQVAASLASRGGRAVGATKPRIFAFPRESARAAALDAVRRDFGWSVVRSA